MFGPGSFHQTIVRQDAIIESTYPIQKNEPPKKPEQSDCSKLFNKLVDLSFDRYVNFDREPSSVVWNMPVPDSIEENHNEIHAKMVSVREQMIGQKCDYSHLKEERFPPSKLDTFKFSKEYEGLMQFEREFAEKK